MEIIPADAVYESWFSHERGARASIREEHRLLFITQVLPERAEWPHTWYRCTLQPVSALNFIVGEGWEGWSDWSRPGGTYFQIAQKIINHDPAIPYETIKKIKTMADALQLEQSILFETDPLILRGRSVAGPFMVIEGHHRASAVSVASITGRSLRPLSVFIGVGS